VLDAAIRVLGTAGTRGLSHRAVDASAGVPEGTTSNYFRSRDALIGGIVERLVALDRIGWEALAAQVRPTTAAELAEAVAGFVRYATGPDRDRTAARHALFLEATVRPQLRAPLAAGRAEIGSWANGWLARFGSTDPSTHSRVLLDYLDGVILHRLSFAGTATDPLPDIRTVIRALLPDLPPIKDLRTEIGDQTT
jgi:DNA-binding transcriptional regulator YbjK